MSDVVNTFCIMTNADIETAQQYLISTNWNLNHAINRYFTLIKDFYCITNTVNQNKHNYYSHLNAPKTQKRQNNLSYSEPFSNNEEISFNRTQRYNLLTLGFGRKYSVPKAIIDLICNFFFHSLYDCWNLQFIYSKSAAKLNWDATIASIADYEITLFSNSIAKMGEIKIFTIKILSFGKKDLINNSSKNNYFQPFIGIIKDDYDTLLMNRDAWSYWSVDEGYQFCAGAAIFRGDIYKNKSYGNKCYSEGNIIQIKIDLIKYNLSYIINGIDYGIACQIDKSNYRLALSGVNIPAKFQLLETE
eukprot:398065_1